jgi:hypothetical protein
MFRFQKSLTATLCGIALAGSIAATVSISTLAPTAAFAADVNARIKGTVTDPGGAVIAHASLTATNQATGVKYVTTSEADGDYLFQQLPVGTYNITASASGFKSFTASGITLTIDQEYNEPIKLAVGSASDTVEVQADAVQVNTTDAQLSNVVDSTEIEELPLISRTFTGLELIEPGVQNSSDRFGTYSVSGAQTQQSEYLINGADSNDIALNTLAIAPNLDAIDQFNLIEGPLNAEYDRNSGGIVSVTVKQGSNKFHGDGFEFYRDTFLNTPGYFQYDPATNSKEVSPYHQNIFGGTVGGPVLKDKLFFFFGYNGTHSRTPDTASAFVFTQAQRSGDFSNDSGNFSSNPIPTGINIPAGCTAGEKWSSCLGLLGGKVPTSDFNAISANLLAKYVPMANGANNAYDTNNGVDATKENQEMGRMDYAFSPKNQVSFVGIYDKLNNTETIPFAGANLPGFGEFNAETIQQYTFDYVRQFSSTAVNDFALHWTRFNYEAVEPQTVVAPSSLGFSINPEDAAAASVPVISVNGYFTLGFSNDGPQPRIDQVYQIDDTFSKTVGHHTLKFGYDGRRFNVSNPFSAENNGSYSFSSTSGQYSTGDAGLDFLLGIPSGYGQGTGAKIQAEAFLNYLFAQDSWKVTPSFTLNYGIGYSIDTPLHNEQYGGEGIACLIPGETSSVFSTSPKGIVYPGDPGCYNSGQATTRHTEFGPRIGFAWSPDLGKLSGGPGKFSIYGGFGIYYNRSEEETALQTLETPPFGLSSSGAADYDGGIPSFGNPYQDINTGKAYTNKFPFTFPTKGATINYAPLEPMDLSTFGKDFRAPYAENFQISVERELPSKVVARLSYVGSLGRHNQITYEGNPETPAGHAACLANPTCVNYSYLQSYLFPGNSAYGEVDPLTGETAFLSVGTVGAEAASSYNALQAKITKGLSHGLNLTASYTYSHALDNGSSFENSGFGESGARGYNQYDKSLNYGDSAYDARHHLVIAPIYVVPKFPGKSDFNPLNLALSGWQISAIETLATGFPYDISYAGSAFNSLWCSGGAYSFYACPDVPLQTASLRRQNPRSTAGSFWFSPQTFASEPIGQFGNIHRDPYHGPGTNNTNMILAKNFFIGSDNVRRLQLRMESDNVFNHTQFSNPYSTFIPNSQGNSGVAPFGEITGSAAARQTQLATKFYF